MTGFVHETAEVEVGARVGKGVKLWHFVHVREGAQIGDETNIGRGAFVDAGVPIGKRCKIGNYACIYAPARIGDGVFIGPGALLINDKNPRAVNEDGTMKGPGDWESSGVIVRDGASIGAGAIIMPGVRIGYRAMIGAGAVVTRHVPNDATVVRAPARRVD